MTHSHNHTTESLIKKIKSPLKRKFVFGFILIIVPIMGFMFTWLGFRIINQGKQDTLEKARVIADQVVLTRQWVTDAMGGVYVDVNSQGAKGVKFATKDKIITPSQTYQLFTPSMVTQKLSQYSFEQKSYQFRLSSLNPINVENTPNDFEAKALNQFSSSSFKEYFQYTDTSFDYMVPLYNTKGCTKCHTSQKKHTTSSIIGGLRVTIPYANIKDSLKKSLWLLAGAGFFITLATIVVLLFFIHNLILKPLNDLEAKSQQLSAGDLTTRVSLHTGDELERLGTSFNQMAKSLMLNRDTLEDKIARATADLAQANQELLKLDKLKSDFLANMSHELRTPLTAVKGSINYLERTVSDKEQLAFIQIIEKNVSRLTRLIATLFDFTRLEAGTIEWEFLREDLGQLLKDVIEISIPIAQGKNIDITHNIPDQLFAVIDFERIEQVLVNLIDNAIKFSDSGGRIDVAAEKKHHHIEIKITDNGSGIRKQDIDTIFKKFYSSSNNTTGKNRGAGMGLAISKAIISAHNGKIKVDSKEGKGSCFTIYLPIQDQTQG